jgi:hypothetical protein
MEESNTAQVVKGDVFLLVWPPQILPGKSSPCGEKGVNFFCNLQIALFFFGTPNARIAR